MMFSRNTPWKRPNDSYRILAMGLGCMILVVQFATAQDNLLRPEKLDVPTPNRLSRIGHSMAGERIVSVTCDPFMTAAQEQLFMKILLEQDDAPWIDLSLKFLKDRLSNVCTVWIDEKALDDESISLDQPLMSEVPTGPLGARLSTLLESNQLAYCVRRNRLEITSRRGNDAGIRRIYDVTPLVHTVRKEASNASMVLAYPLVQLIESTVCPDCWQAAGGNSTICEFVPPSSSDCVCLVVASSTENHLAIQNLLDHLNSFGISNGTPKSTRQTTQTTQIKHWQADRLEPRGF